MIPRVTPNALLDSSFHLGSEWVYHGSMESAPTGMHPLTWKILQALRGGARLSRNRNYSLFKDPHARRGLRLYRFLQSVVKDVRAHADDIQVTRTVDEDHPSEFELRLDFPVIHGRRTTYLKASELELVAQDAPEVAELINQYLRT